MKNYFLDILRITYIPLHVEFQLKYPKELL